MAATLLALGAVGAESSNASSGQRLPIIRQVKPGKGLPAGGTKVELFGQPLEKARAVYFGTVPGRIVEEECGGECEITPYRWLLVESPPHPPGKVNVTFESGVGEVSAPDPRAQFIYKGAGHGPAIAGVSAPEIAETNAETRCGDQPNGLATTFAFWVRYEPCQNGAGECAIRGPETELVAEGELPRRLSARVRGRDDARAPPPVRLRLLGGGEERGRRSRQQAEDLENARPKGPRLPS